jgi:hypothetical protein
MGVFPYGSIEWASTCSVGLYWVKVRHFVLYRTSYLAHSFHSTHVRTYEDIRKCLGVRLAPNASLHTGIASNVIQPWALGFLGREEKHRMKEISVTRAYGSILPTPNQNIQGRVEETMKVENIAT